MLVRRTEPPASAAVTITVDGRDVRARKGESVAAAVLAAGIVPTRLAPVSGAPRAPYCLMGSCYECLMTVDDRANVQACMTPVKDGMRVRTHASRPSLRHG